MTQGALVANTLISAWISNYNHYKVWDEIIYPFSNFNYGTSKWSLIHAGIKVIQRFQLPAPFQCWQTIEMWCIFFLNSLWPSDAIWRHRCGSILAQVMACCLTAPNHYLNQWGLMVSTDQWRLSRGNFTRYPKHQSQKSASICLDKFFFKSPRGQWVKINSAQEGLTLSIIWMNGLQKQYQNRKAWHHLREKNMSKTYWGNLSPCYSLILLGYFILKIRTLVS